LVFYDGCKTTEELVVQRFVPSEFLAMTWTGSTLDPAKPLYAVKSNLQRLIEAKGIPHTYVACNSFAKA
jgi:phenylcoumaran benzylic ether reductase